MEPEGLRRCLHQVLDGDDMDVGTIATDQHLMVGKMMKDDHPEVLTLSNFIVYIGRAK